MTQIIIGKSERSRWFEILHGSVVHDLIRKTGSIRVQVVSGEDLAGEAIPKKTVRAAQEQASFNAIPYVWALLSVGAALAAGWSLQSWIGIESVDLIFLTAIVGVAVQLGLLPSLVASVAASLSYNFFFLPPIFTFTITDPTNVAAFVSFTIVAVIVSNVAARMRSQAVIAVSRASTTEQLYAFSRKLGSTGSLDDVLWATAFQIASMLKVRVVLMLPENGSIEVQAGYPPEDRLEPSDLAAASWAWKNDRAAGRGADTLPGAQRLFLPMRTGRGAIGVIGIDSDKPGPLLTPDQRRLLDALIDQAALAIERVHLVEDMDRVRRTVETDRLRSALLTSISHDLKTPLSAVLGAAGTLRDLSANLNDDQKAELLATIIDESERLNRFIANLLDMTKLESGAVVANLSLHDVGEIVGSALRRASRNPRSTRGGGGPRRPICRCCRSTPCSSSRCSSISSTMPRSTRRPGRRYAFAGRQESDWIAIEILDEGEGIPPHELEHIFDKFYRARKGDHVRPGTGLGLAISRGFIEAMNGTVSAANRADRTGAVFTIRLPIPAQVSHRDLTS